MAEYKIASATLNSEPSISYIRDCSQPEKMPTEVRSGPPVDALYIVGDAEVQPAWVFINGVRYNPHV